MSRRIGELLFRAVGAVNSVLSLVGLYVQLQFAARVLSHPPQHATTLPHFRMIFCTQVAINIVFVALLLTNGIQLLRFRLAAARNYIALVVASIGYTLIGGGMWLLPGGVGTSIAAGSGVGNMAMGVFFFCFRVPFLYPAISVAILLLLRRRMRKFQQATTLSNCR